MSNRDGFEGIQLKSGKWFKGRFKPVQPLALWVDTRQAGSGAERHTDSSKPRMGETKRRSANAARRAGRRSDASRALTT